MIYCSDGDDGAGEAEAAFHGGAGETARATREETPRAREQKEQKEGGTKVNQLQHGFISLLVPCTNMLASFLATVGICFGSHHGFKIDFTLNVF